MAASTPGQVKQGLTKLGAILVEPFKSKDKMDDGSQGEQENA
jgi:hypothetical protein